MTFNFDLNTFFTIVLSAGAAYAAFRADMAAMKVRLDHLERDFYQQENP